MAQPYLQVSQLIMMHRITTPSFLRSLVRLPRLDPKRNRRHASETRSASDHHSDESNEPRISSSKAKKHADRGKSKKRSRYVSSSEGDHSPAPRHSSSQPSGAVSDTDQPQHDPDPPYYRDVALSDVPLQYAEEVDTFRRILALPDRRESMPSVTYIGHYISTLYITYIRHYISALFNLSFMFINCHKR